MLEHVRADSYIRNKKGIYLAIGKTLTDQFGLPEYHRDMAWDDIPDPMKEKYPDTCELGMRIEHEIQKSHSQIETNTLLFTPCSGLALHTIKRNYIGNGKILGQCELTYLNDQYHRWPQNLKPEKQHLTIPGTEKVIDRRNLIMIYLFLNGYPRKNIGTLQNCSVKAIEKRLARVKEILTPKGINYHNLHHALRSWQLVEFIMAAPNGDWFSLKR